MMRFYQGQHRFYSGIDLHARLLAICIVDQVGTIVLRKHIPDDKQMLLEVLAPFRPDVVLCVAKIKGDGHVCFGDLFDRKRARPL